MFDYFKKIKLLLTKQDKKTLYFLFLFSILISVIETVGVSIIMPFISVASDFELIHSNKYYKFIYELFGFTNNISFVLSFAGALILFYIFRSLINIFYIYLISSFSFSRYHLIAYRLFENYLGRQYREHIKRNSSELTKTIISEAMGLTSIITSALYILSEVLVIVFIYILLIVINWQITLLLTLLLMVNAIVLIKSISKRMKKAGQKRESYEKVFFKILNSTFGNFKLIKLKGNENEIKEKFNHTSYEYSRTGTVNATLNALPKLVLEALSFSIVIIIIAYLIYSYQTDISEVLSIISVFVLGLYRLMPSVNRIITNYNNIIFKHRALEIIHNDLIYEVEDLNDEVIEFNSKITIKNLDFEYTSHRKILDNINFSIQKGESIALVGRSGSGKSTLVDIIIGLFRPSQGNIYVDGLEINNLNIKQWRKKIGYIPQSIYLFDGTVAENVAFGDSIDESKVKDSLQKANLLEFLDEYHDGIDTQVGEDGIKLSGGQKQRIAIARAMYGNPEILVLDEATSALDTDTESKIMDEIYNISKDKTLIVISHRLSTVKRCNRIFKLKDGKLRE